MKKQIKIVACLLAVLFLLSACGGNPGNADGDSDGVKVITMWINKAESDDEGKIYRALVDQFNDAGVKSADEASTLRVRLEFKGTADTLSMAISSEILTGGLPDIIAIDASSYAAYQSEGVIVPIGDFITQDEKDAYVDSVINQATINGQLYGLSALDAPGGLYYNKNIITKDVLTKAGLKDYEVQLDLVRFPFIF